MNVLSLFDGISGMQLALNWCNIQVDNYYASEVDPYAIDVTQSNFPETIQLGDVKEWRHWGLPKIDLLSAGSPCFVAGTKIITKDKYKNIEDVCVGDLVLTHTGEYHKVLKTGFQKKETVILKSQGIKQTETTLNHPYYIREMVRKWDNSKRTSYRFFKQPVWKETKDIQSNDFIGLPILTINKNHFNLTRDECYILGRYVADGHTRKDFRKSEGRPNDRHWQLILSVGSHKTNQFSNIKLKYSCYKHSVSVHRIVFSSKRLVEIAESECGSGAIDKKISMKLLDLPKESLSVFLEGYFDGDGYVNSNNVTTAQSISCELIQTLNLAIAKAYNVNSMFSEHKVSPTTVIEGRVVNQHNAFCTAFRDKLKKQSTAYIENNIIWLRFNKLLKTGSIKKVYNLEVESDNSYTANNAIVHNCTNLSFAGRQKGLSTKCKVEITSLEQYEKLKKDGFQFEGQSYLFWEFIAIRDHLKPKYFLLENVMFAKKWKDIFSAAIGFESTIINSALVSAQNRRRQYWAGKLGADGAYSKIEIGQPEDLSIFLKDVVFTDAKDPTPSLLLSEKALNYMDRQVNGGRTHWDFKHHSDVRNLKSAAVAANFFKGVPYNVLKDIHCIRYFDPVECCRLQTYPDDYLTKAEISKTQKFKMLGNSFTVKVIEHIVKGSVMNKNKFG